MENQENAPRRGTSVRKATGRIPVAQDSPPEEAAPAAAPETSAPAGASKAGTGRVKRGTGSIPRQTPGERLLATKKPPSKIGAIVKTVAILLVFVGVPALVVAGFFVTKNGISIWRLFAIQMGWAAKPKPSAKADAQMSDMDVKYNTALILRTKAEMFLKIDVRKAKDSIETLDGAAADELHGKLKALLDEVTASLADIEAVVNETNKSEGTTLSKVDNLGANAEMNNQTKFRKELLNHVNEWKEIADLKTGRVQPKPAPELAKTPEAPKEPEKPVPAEPGKPKPAPNEEDPIAKALEGAKPKEPEKPKAAPKEEDPIAKALEGAKPKESEKPAEPAKPAEPEKPKPVEPEKPKPAEPEKPVEPEKPKPPAKTPQQLIADAELLITEGNPLALEAVQASRPIPEDAGKRKDVLIQCETAAAFFQKAQGLLEGAKEAPGVAEKLLKIEKVLGVLQKLQDEIKSK